jgi:hypothetical protein
MLYFSIRAQQGYVRWVYDLIKHIRSPPDKVSWIDNVDKNIVRTLLKIQFIGNILPTTRDKFLMFRLIKGVGIGFRLQN